MHRCLSFAEIVTALALFCGAIAIVPYANLPTAGTFGAFITLLFGIAIAIALVACLPFGRISALFDRVALTSPLLIISSGLALQVVVGLISEPTPVSDAATYLRLAARLASGESYIANGKLAYWPPGLPLFLTPFVAAIGAGLAAIITANAALFVIGALGIWFLAKKLFSPSTGAIALFLYTLWPSRLLSSGLAAKENLTVAFVVAGLALFVLALDRRTTPNPLYAAVGGFAFGVAALAQPGLMLFVFSLPLMLRFWFRQSSWRYLITFSFAVTAGYLSAVGPWHWRNCVVFEGKFCGISTNGGSVAYRANNPLATGLYISKGEIDLELLPEVDQNKAGFELARAWITQNPEQFALLSLRKLFFLLSSDQQGAYWSVLRGVRRGTEIEAMSAASETRRIAYSVLRAVSNLFWVFLLVLCGRGCVRLLLIAPEARSRYVLLLYPIIYCAAVFSVFESGARQHMVAVGPMLILAAWSLRRGFDLPPTGAPIVRPKSALQH